ncbi:queuine tRNA-ribosyltransferase catalytic subunit 1-like [Panonychus citri]|uniref:queuine tRNA-ribosyltransferase catalytic subunit 1-like n=1 Tax=Panonychus citri TaxID=50023 RepID=UPI002307E74E|nr:queuine tRNA-ribosyltransferase catalytic subunit 1-like [Panonychus citri]
MKALEFKVVSKCKSTRGRKSDLILEPTSPHGARTLVKTPVFMPVGTNGTLKGFLPDQIEATGCNMMLSNTYHLASRPGAKVVAAAGGLHKFMNWKNGLLTDSGGFQMVSLSKLMELDENGVVFTSPYDDAMETVLTPEGATSIQHEIGANIIMQLDDVISSTHSDKDRFIEATHRTIRWYDRCKTRHSGSEGRQNLFPIVQGGLDPDLRAQCAKEIASRDPPGVAIGGLSGGECKVDFIKMVACSTANLPEDKPRYLMGVGFAVDLILCSALGVDMFDCVYPTRTARFGCALVGLGTKLNLKWSTFQNDLNVIETGCDCYACANNYKRSLLYHLLKKRNTVACHLISQHNVRFQMRFMNKIKESIECGNLPSLIIQTLDQHYKSKKDYPEWVLTALEILKIEF